MNLTTVLGYLLFSVSLGAAEVHVAEVAKGALETAGKTSYENYCQACHQADGYGLKGAFPPLAGSDYLLEDTRRGIDAVLLGGVW